MEGVILHVSKLKYFRPALQNDVKINEDITYGYN